MYRAVACLALVVAAIVAVDENVRRSFGPAASAARAQEVAVEVPLPVVDDRLATEEAFAGGAPAIGEAPASEQVLAGSEPRLGDIPQPPPIEPPTQEAIEEAIRRGVAYLLADQGREGWWGSPHRTKGLNIYAPVPGSHQAFRAAVTAMCISALIETGDDSAEVAAALDRGENWLLEHLPRVRRATPDALYNVWTHGYAIDALARMHRRHAGNPERQAECIAQIEAQLDRLVRYESVDGGWGYYDFNTRTQRPGASSTSFVTAAILVALDEARGLDMRLPEKVLERAVASIERQMKPDFSYLYGEYLKWYPMMGINRPGGSLGRSQACNIALRRYGDERITDEVLRAWLDRLCARNGWLSIGRKRPIPHESWFQVAGYFYYFGHYYAALCVEELPAADQRYYQDYLAYLLLPLQERDGSWWDYPFYNYHQQYGTAFALMTLARCRHTAPQISAASGGE